MIVDSPTTAASTLKRKSEDVHSNSNSNLNLNVASNPEAWDKRFCTEADDDDSQILDLTVSTANSRKSADSSKTGVQSDPARKASPSSSPSPPSSTLSAVHQHDQAPSASSWFPAFGMHSQTFGPMDLNPLLQQQFNLFSGFPLPPGVTASLSNLFPLVPQATIPSQVPQIHSTLVADPQAPLNLNMSSSLWSQCSTSTSMAHSESQINNALLSQISGAMGLCTALSQAQNTRNPATESTTSAINGCHSGNTSPANALSTGPLDFRSAAVSNDDALDDQFPPRPSSNPICKYASFDECGLPRCENAGLREHYHCTCCDKVIIRREEVIRHAKWHRKREESLQYGFMRYSPGDDCNVADCVHNGRQTHYHCLKSNCSKVYISTSDVQMHANFHRKDEVIIQEGFRRFRASEDCGQRRCPFYQEHTTHFHCRRMNCHFTFKNKADMEKHKLHHQKNDNFAKDGFRKFIKCETCGFPNCKYSGIINHIHCVRPGCDYVVHSSSQILSHKRKHDRRDSNNSLNLLSGITYSDPGSKQSIYDLTSADNEVAHSTNCYDQQTPEPMETSPRSSEDGDTTKDLFCDLSRLVTRCIQRHQRATSTTSATSDLGRTTLQSFLFAPQCDEATNVEYITDVVECHRDESSPGEESTVGCIWPGCNVTKSTQNRIDRCPDWISHVWQAALLRMAFVTCKNTDCPEADTHLHCYYWPNCELVVTKETIDFHMMYTHIIKHDPRVSSENSDALEMSTAGSQSNQDQSSSDQAFQLPRRRGRPPKYAKYIRVPRPSVPEELCKDNPHIREIKRSMFIPPEILQGQLSSEEPTPIVCGVKLYRSHEACPDNLCQYTKAHVEHYHCVRPRCFMASDNLDLINVHRREFHNHVTIAPGFEHFDQSVNCRRPACHNKQMTQHYHCTYANCDYAFIRPTTMIQHARKHELSKMTRSYFGKNVTPLKLRPSLHHQPGNPHAQRDSVGNFDSKPPCLPLGMSPLVAAQLPSFLPPGEVRDYQQTTNSPVVNNSGEKNGTNENENLPGFLPFWAAAMAAAVATMTKTGTDTTTSHANGVVAHSSLDGFRGLDATRSSLLDARVKDEEAPVGV